jgi:hypothetical protein
MWTVLVIACTKVNLMGIKNFISTFDFLEMSASGNTWEGYQWVDGWPVSPPRPRLQQQPPREPATTDEGEMAVETDLAAEADTSTVHSTVYNADDNSLAATKQSETAYQVKDFDTSLAGSTYSSEDETDEDIPNEKQVELEGSTRSAEQRGRLPS